VSDHTLGARTETYLVEEKKEELFDEELPVKLPPPVRSYTIKGRMIRVEKATPLNYL